jgi:very-short-patch-repair endonuclease
MNTVNCQVERECNVLNSNIVIISNIGDICGTKINKIIVSDVSIISNVKIANINNDKIIISNISNVNNNNIINIPNLNSIFYKLDGTVNISMLDKCTIKLPIEYENRLNDYKINLYNYLNRDNYLKIMDNIRYKSVYYTNNIKLIDTECKRGYGHCKKYSCKNCYPRSFLLNENSKYYTTNNKEDPLILTNGSHKECNFFCIICGHIYNKEISEIIRGYSCPHCSHKKLCTIYNCYSCFYNSFASTGYSKYWDYIKNKGNPRDYFKNTHDKFYFICINCDHSLYKNLSDITSRDKGCVYCTNQELCGILSCIFCLNKSLASHEDVRLYSSKNELPAHQVAISSNMKCIFNCDFCPLETVRSVSDFTYGGCRCICSINKTETKLFTYLQDNYNVSRNVRINWSVNNKTGRQYEYDIVLNDYNIIIELDGRQHFEKVENWGDLDVLQDRDVDKMILAINNNFSLIRIFQPDVWNNINNWDTNLMKAINMLINNIPKILMINKELYSKHYNLLKDKGISDDVIIFL